MEIQSFSPSSTNQTLELKPIFGTGREERRKAAEKILQKNVEPLYGFIQKAILTEAEKSEIIKCRILQENKEFIGLLIYDTSLPTLKDRFARCLQIKLLYAADQTNKQAERLPQSAYLLNEVNAIAKSLEAESLSIQVPKGADFLYKFFAANQFRVVEDDRNFYLYAKNLKEIANQSPKKEEDLKNGSRKRGYENNPNSPLKKRFRSESNVDNFHERNFEEPNKGKFLPRSKSSSDLNRPTVKEMAKKFESRQQASVCPIKRNYFFMIQQGKKTVEGRINTGMFQRLRKGQEIQFINGEDKVLCEITKINKYGSFAEMLDTEGVKPCLPDVNSLEEAKNVYNSISGYAVKAAKFGVLAIHIKVKNEC